MHRPHFTHKIAALGCAVLASAALTACGSEDTTTQTASSPQTEASSMSDASSAPTNAPTSAQDGHRSGEKTDSAERPDPTSNQSDSKDTQTTLGNRQGESDHQASGRTTGGSKQPANGSQLELVDTQTVVSSKSSVKCDVTRYKNSTTGQGEVHARCMTKDAPQLSYLPDCVPSASQSPIIVFNGRNTTLDCTTQGSQMAKVVPTTPGDSKGVTIAPPNSGGTPLTLVEEASGEAIQLKINGRARGIIGPGRIELPS
ncbi:hypothetical protein [Corynebacterium sp. HMSC28B08]|uniref:hypothetical protein n=1 Tax=Corynebacterium TaxID=1716 RepID=UPI0008A6658B|nr:hypothetical protein [Corynebacterium sp. HMSC28B08]OFT90689.1 hypothetical protein HMPREF3098_02755 [Corynebacterium sp. HMSC28B08]